MAKSFPPSDSTSPAVPEAGARIGRYVLLERIAEGGMGVVYAAYDAGLDRKVAIKVLRGQLLRDRPDGADVQARLFREAQAMARLAHPNVVAVHDVGTHDGSVFLAMEYVSGGTLKERLRQPAPWRERLQLLMDAGRGLAAAHAAGLVHRDFKPDNVLVGTDGRVRVTDFGIARAEETGRSPAAQPPRAALPPASPALPLRAAPPAPSVPSVAEPTSVLLTASTSSRSIVDPLTMTGDVLGTVGYMPPEQMFGEPVDARSDQFSFCVTLYVALYGTRPFPGDDLGSYGEALSRPVREAPASSKVPAWLRRAVLKGLAVDPADRYASMAELLAALGRDPAVRRKRWLTAGAVAALAIALGAFTSRAASRAIHACDARGDLTSAWGPAVREDVRRAFTASGANGASDSFARVAKVLDAYASGWSSREVALCEASGGAPPADEGGRARAECLDRAQTELRAMTSLFARADRDTVAQSVAAAYGLSSLAWCDDAKALRASPGLPLDPARRTSVLAARTALAEATSLRLAGKSTEALERAERALGLARDAGHRSTEAEALFFLAHNRQRMGDYARSERELQDAMAVAYAAKDDATLVRTADDLAFIVGDKLYRPEEAHRALDFARAGLERIGGGDELESDVLSTDALLLITEGQADRSIPMLEQVVRLERRFHGEAPTTAIYLNDIGYAMHLAGRNEEALPVLTEARAMLDTIYGSDRFDSGIPLCNLGAASLALGRRDDAMAYLTKALDLFEGENPGGFWSAWALQYLALGATLGGDADAGVAFGRRGLAIADRLRSSLRIAPGLSVATADALLASKRPDEALPLCDRALAIEEQVQALGPDKILDWDALRCRGEALVALGRAAEARAPLERAASLPRRAFPWDLARAKLALARALDATGDAERAKELRTDAIAALGQGPYGDRIAVGAGGGATEGR